MNPQSIDGHVSVPGKNRHAAQYDADTRRVEISMPDTSASAVPRGPANIGLPGMEPPAVMKPTYGRLIAAAIIMPCSGCPMTRPTRKPDQMGYNHVLVMEWLNHQVQHVAISATMIA
jgi:hypothetical protein